jgi:hypothetical protein
MDTGNEPGDSDPGAVPSYIAMVHPEITTRQAVGR